MEKGYLLYGRYRIDSILGRGGMGSVYRAVDENLAIPVAVKENLFTTEEYARQFRREATILAGLRHSNLPRVTDHFVIPGQGQYLVMDFVDGEDLRTRIEKGNLPSERLVLDWAGQICDALHYLHNRQPPVVHRDIKPGNIRITPDGRAVLVDFGLARLMEGPTTTTGAKAMTPGYSPPEQYGASRTDSRTDIYALAATLYTLLTGAMPEDGLERALGQKSLTPIRVRNPRIAPAVSSAIEKALEVLPENRYQTIDEFDNALHSGVKAAPESIPTVAVPPRKIPPKATNAGGKSSSPPVKPAPVPRSNSRLPFGCIAFSFLVFVVIAVVVGFFLAKGTDFLNAIKSPSTLTALPSLGSTAFSMVTELPTGTPILPTDTQIPTETPTLISTPIGRSFSITFVSDQTGVPQIYTMDFDGGNQKQLTDLPEGACQPDWSPDGTQLIFVSPCKTVDASFINTAIYRINADGSGSTLLTRMSGGDYDPAWSPDGTRIAFTTLQYGGRHIYIMDSNGENRVQISPNGAVDSQPRWSPDGRQLVFVSQNLDLPSVLIMKADGSNRSEFSSVTYRVMSPDWSIGNLILYVLGSKGEVVAANLNNRYSLIEMSPPYRGSTYARFSPDGQWILFDMLENDNRDIYLLRVVGSSEPTRLTTDSSRDTDPTWRPVPSGS